MSVYAIRCGGLIKIGFSENPARRCAKLFRGSTLYSAPRAAYEARGTQVLVHVIEKASKSDECLIHRLLDDFAIGCEWFVDEQPVHDVLAAYRVDDLSHAHLWPRRVGGPVWESMPREELGGCNSGPTLALLAKRQGAPAP